VQQAFHFARIHARIAQRFAPGHGAGLAGPRLSVPEAPLTNAAHQFQAAKRQLELSIQLAEFFLDAAEVTI